MSGEVSTMDMFLSVHQEQDGNINFTYHENKSEKLSID